MPITKRDSEPCNRNTENPFCIVYRVECRSHWNKFLMKMHVCLLKPEISKLSFVKKHTDTIRGTLGLHFQAEIHYWWIGEISWKSFVLRLLEYFAQKSKGGSTSHAMWFVLLTKVLGSNLRAGACLSSWAKQLWLTGDSELTTIPVIDLFIGAPPT